MIADPQDIAQFSDQSSIDPYIYYTKPVKGRCIPQRRTQGAWWYRWFYWLFGTSKVLVKVEMPDPTVGYRIGYRQKNGDTFVLEKPVHDSVYELNCNHGCVSVFALRSDADVELPLKIL